MDGTWISSSERTTPESLRDLRPSTEDFKHGSERERKTEKEISNGLHRQSGDQTYHVAGEWILTMMDKVEKAKNKFIGAYKCT